MLTRDWTEDAMEYVSEATPFVSSEAGGNYDVRGDLVYIAEFRGNYASATILIGVGQHHAGR